jgi:ornithine carbamoyltransferase
MCYIGDGNNMANSLIVGGLKVGMTVSVATPDNYRPDKKVMDFAEKFDCFSICNDPMEAAKNADILITDVWASMGQEGEAEERKKIFKDYQINDSVVEVSNEGVMVLHCLPAHRGEEITAKVLEEHASEIFDEAENRLHAQKAVLVKCMAD